jgi:hypothetical protein
MGEYISLRKYLPKSRGLNHRTSKESEVLCPERAEAAKNMKINDKKSRMMSAIYRKW